MKELIIKVSKLSKQRDSNLFCDDFDNGTADPKNRCQDNTPHLMK